MFLVSPFLLKEYIYLAQIMRSLLINKNGILHCWKSQWFNSYKTVRQFTKWPFKMILSAHDTIKWLNYVVHYLNLKIKWTFVEKLMHNFVVHSNEILCKKRWHFGLDQVIMWYQLRTGIFPSGTQYGSE